jgi:hypothetical protein
MKKSIVGRKQSSARSASQVAHHRNLDKRDLIEPAPQIRRLAAPVD